jgi:biopolymer transport protein ExbB
MLEFLRSGGPVLWLVLALGAIALVVFLERSLQLHRDRIDSTDFLQGIFNALRRGNAQEALALCEETPGPVARLAGVAIRRRGAPRERLLQELDQAGTAEVARMERRLAFLSLIAQAAPLLGLLGTALGILRSLLAWRAALPLADSAGIADGLVAAALTTAAGLAVALPCYLGFNVLVVKIDRLVLDMRDAVSECVWFLERNPVPESHA